MSEMKRLYRSTDGSWPVPESEMNDTLRVLRDDFYLSRYEAMLTPLDHKFLKSMNAAADTCVDLDSIVQALEDEAARKSLSGETETNEEQ